MPVSSKSNRPLHNRFQPYSGWATTICAASRSELAFDGHFGVCKHNESGIAFVRSKSCCRCGVGAVESARGFINFLPRVRDGG